jgi:hypothetical protein
MAATSVVIVNHTQTIFICLEEGICKVKELECQAESCEPPFPAINMGVEVKKEKVLMVEFSSHQTKRESGTAHLFEILTAIR